MSHLVTILLLTLSILLTSLSTPALPASISDIFSAVRPLTDADGNVRCTVSLINKKKAFWLTASHCIASEAAIVYIDHLPAYLQDRTNIQGEGDMAILFSPAATVRVPHALKLATRRPLAGDRIRIVGFPTGIGPILTQGYIGFPSVFFRYYNETLMSFDVSVCGGNSGSSVVNSRNEIVSVLTRYHYPAPPCMALAAGPTHTQLRTFAGRYF